MSEIDKGFVKARADYRVNKLGGYIKYFMNQKNISIINLHNKTGIPVPKLKEIINGNIGIDNYLISRIEEALHQQLLIVPNNFIDKD